MTWPSRLAAGVLLVLVTLGGVAGTAWAYWSAAGSGSGSATTATLEPPPAVTATADPGVAAVTVAWPAPGGGVAPEGYLVHRTSEPEGTTTPACGGATITDLTCVDSPVPDGAFTYTVTSAYASWRTPSDPSDPVTITTTPTDTTAPIVTINAITSVGGSGKVRVSGSGETGLPLVVTLCFSPTPNPAACTLSETVTIAAVVGGAWQVTSQVRSQVPGTWFATATQVDAAGNSTTATASAPLP